MHKKQILGSCLAIFGGMCWGISGTVAQYLFTQHGISALWLNTLRMFGAGVILMVWYFLRSPGLALAPWHSKADRKQLLVYGLFGVTLCQLLYFLTIQLSTAGVATILQDLSPIMVLACTCIAAKRKPFGNEILSIVLAITGVFLIVTHGNLQSFAVSPLALLTGILCAATVTVYNVYPKHLLATYPVPLLQGWSFLMGGTLYMLLFHPWTWGVTLNLQVVLGVIAVMVLGNLLAFNCYMKGVALIGGDKACLYGFSEPVIAAVLSFACLGSPFTLWDGFGFVCIFLMMVMLSLRQLKKAETQVNPSAGKALYANGRRFNERSS